MRTSTCIGRLGLGLVLLAASACGGSSSGAVSSPSATSSVSAKDYDTARWREFGMTSAEYADAIERVQAAIAECMANAGFQYFPATVETIETAQDNVRLQPPQYGRIEYKKKWGYGETTRFDNRVKQIELGKQNLAYIASLSEVGKEAYERTLYGEDPDMTFAWTFDEEDFSETGGCTRKAVEQVFTKEQILGTYVNPKDVVVENDPRIVKAERAWVACMEAKGYEGYEDQDEIIEEFAEQLDELLGEDDPEDLEGERLQELKDLQEEEVAASLADVECQIKHTDKVYDEVELEVFGRSVSGTIRS